MLNPCERMALFGSGNQSPLYRTNRRFYLMSTINQLVRKPRVKVVSKNKVPALEAHTETACAVYPKRRKSTKKNADFRVCGKRRSEIFTHLH